MTCSSTYSNDFEDNFPSTTNDARQQLLEFAKLHSEMVYITF